jgi:phosphonate transport system substrate-binding protein
MRRLRGGLALIVPAVALATAMVLLSGPAVRADDCTHRGQLDALYCDENNDLVADAPTDPRKWQDPATLVFTYTPVEDPVLYQFAFRPFTDYLGRCTGKRVVYYPASSNTTEVEAMRSGRLHIAGFSTGPTGFAVNLAGAVPFAAKGTDSGVQGYRLIAVVRKDSPYQKLSDLKGRRVAHTSAASNSGNLAPRVLFPPQGLTPERDYQPLMSGSHDKSALGVAAGDYDMAPVASDVFDRMVSRGTLNGDDFRILYSSPVFPTSSFAYAHDLAPRLASKIKECFYAFRFTDTMIAEFNRDDRFVPITYKEHWAVVREIAEKTGTSYTQTAFEAEARRVADEQAGRQRQAPPPFSK